MKNIKKFKLNLMGKLTGYFLALIIIPVIVLGYFSYDGAKKSLQTEAESKIKITLDSAVNDLNMKTSQIKEQVNLIANLSQIESFLESYNIGKVEATVEGNVKKLILDYQKSASDMTSGIFLADNKGNIILDSNNSKGINILDRDYFKESISGNPTWSGVLTSKVSNKPEINYSCPIKSQDGKVKGVIVASIKFESITNLLAQVKSGESGYAFMVDENGLVLYHPDKDKILKENMVETYKDNSGLTNILKSMLADKEGDGVYEYSGVEKYVAYKPFESWSVAINIPVKEYMVGAINIRNKTIAISIIAIIIGALVAIVVSKKITNPIKSLMVLMGKAKEGDLTVRSEIKLDDEIGQLSNSFNAMLAGQQNAVIEVLSTAKDVEASSKIVGESASEMAAAAENQSSSSEELTATINEMSTSIVEASESISSISENVNNISCSTGEMSKSSTEMSKKVEETAAMMIEVTKSLQEMDASIEMVASNSSKANDEALKTEDLAKEGRVKLL
ncbi:PDC sensor domain-containing protein [Clostridium brassicae]|uniref:Methyl-accepting chemotaxis protein n=1 Tax=Clostridium brassicae TaxID=2999072 RepID=A0ABT4DBE2_9CLOT|nr:methyl-accepting chemotaxis protein [Clostridium brassicae]MCY6959513.1 methyl-accepting chemotaxis protein [Clostridium brassicae]